MAAHQPIFSGADDEAWIREVAVALFVVLMAVVTLWVAFALV